MLLQASPPPAEHSAHARLSFRGRLIMASVATVLVTLLLMLVPLYLAGRAQVTTAYRERLLAVAHGASLTLSSDTVDQIASGASGIPYLVARTQLREFWPAQPPDTGATAPRTGLALVRATPDGYVIVAHSAWPGDPPRRPVRWTPPAALADSLQTQGAAVTPRYWFVDAGRLMAVSPVRDENSIVHGLVVASVDAGQAAADTRREILKLAGYPLAALVLAFGLSSWLARQLTGRVQALAAQAQLLGRGDLRGELTDDSEDELGVIAHALRELRANLRELLLRAGDGARAVRDTAAELAAGASQLHAASAETAGVARTIAAAAESQHDGIRSISAIAASAAEQAQAVTHNTRDADEAASSIEAAVRLARTGGAEALEQMDAIARAAGEALPAVAEMGRKSARVGEVSHAIAYLASQSRLLALNAAIEAARAGEHGRGFSVVAAEVDKLARRTEEALRSIDELSSEMTGLSGQAQARVREVEAAVERGNEVIRGSAQSLARIGAAVHDGRAATRAITEQAGSQQERAATVSEQVRGIAAAASGTIHASRDLALMAESQVSAAGVVDASSQRLLAVVAEMQGAVALFEL